MLWKFLERSSITRKNFLIVFMLIVNVFTWLYMMPQMINNVLSGINIAPEQNPNLIIWAAHYIAIIGSGIVGAVLSRKINRLKFLYLWIIFGVFTSLLPAVFNIFTLSHALVISILLGVSFGLGMPSCLAYFAECTIVENRGRIGGISFLVAILCVPLLTIPLQTFNLTVNAIIIAIWRGTGLIIFFLKPEKHSTVTTNKNVSFASILSEKSFLLYFVAWFMFPLVDQFEGALVVPFLTGWMPSLLDTMGVVEPIVAGLSILIAGMLCDLIGRKKIVLSGFVALGVAYAIIGLDPRSVISWYLYFIVDGVAWGIFLLTFVLILWGDLSQPGSREKYYALGSIPFFLSYIIPQFLTESFVEQIALSAAFSLASFFLFIAVMPLVFAPETLPEKKMELRRLRKFAEEARKTKEKYENKKKK